MCYQNETKVREIARGDFTIEIHADYDPVFDPMDEELLTTFVCWHRRYTLGNANTDSRTFVKGRPFFPDPEDFMDYWKDENLPIVMPLYMYDHSGIGISVDNSRYPYNCPWDSGQLGYIYVTKEKILETYGGKYLTKKKLELARKTMLAEVKYYNSYLSGEIYGYKIISPEDEELESCWGYIGDYEEMLPEVYAEVDYYQKELNKEKWELAKQYISMFSESRG